MVGIVKHPVVKTACCGGTIGAVGFACLTALYWKTLQVSTCIFSFGLACDDDTSLGDKTIEVITKSAPYGLVAGCIIAVIAPIVTVIAMHLGDNPNR